MQDSLHSGIGSPSMTGLSPARSVRLRLAHMQQRRLQKGVKTKARRQR